MAVPKGLAQWPMAGFLKTELAAVAFFFVVGNEIGGVNFVSV
jgi:hypothetical protein